MRKDIQIHIATNDVTLSSQNKVTLREFHWVEMPENKETRYIYGEIVVPTTVSERQIIDNGVYIAIPYTPKYKEMRFRIKRDHGREDETYILNATTGDIWFDVKAAFYGVNERNIFASELFALSQDRYYCIIENNAIRIYSGHETDFNITKANTQNKNLLLACIPGNNYRYPMTGVGLIRWANSNIDVAGLADVLIREYSDDGTPVKDAQYNHELRQLYLTLDTSSVDSDGNI